MGKAPMLATPDNDDLDDFVEDEDDIIFDDEKYLRNRRDSKSMKARQTRRPRRNSTGNAEMDNAIGKQPQLEQIHVTEVKPRRQSSSSFEEVDIEDELAMLVKDMKLENVSESAEPLKNVYYYGWFFGPTTSESLTKFSEATLKECLEVAQFQRWIDKIGSTEKCGRDVSCFYENCFKAPLHITAKFMRGQNHRGIYAAEARLNTGKEFNLAIIGFYFTEKSYGLRIKLSEDEMRLFDTEPGRGQLTTNRRNSTTNVVDQGAAQEKKKNVAGAVGHVDKKHLKDYPGLNFVLQRENFQPTDTRAHITIGTGSNVPPKQTGDDLLDIVDMEQRSTTLYHDYKVPSGTLRQFGRGGDYVFVLYPKTRLFVKGVFMPVFR